MSESATISIESFELCTQDNTSISAKQYLCNAPKAQIVIAGATGVPQGFYGRWGCRISLFQNNFYYYVGCIFITWTHGSGVI